tara:strand:+ start:71 stop:355 length:285 start_codon:yes stop_codon:yes gene_type:complete
MAEYKITLKISETDQKVLSNDLDNKADNAGITAWIENALKGKISSCYKRMSREWTEQLMNDSSFTDSIPSNKEDLIKLILSQPTYKNRNQQEKE